MDYSSKGSGENNSSKNYDVSPLIKKEERIAGTHTQWQPLRELTEIINHAKKIPVHECIHHSKKYKRHDE